MSPSPSINIHKLIPRLINQRIPPPLYRLHPFPLRSQLILHAKHLLQRYLSNASTLPYATTHFHQIREPNKSTLEWLEMIRKHASDATNPIKALHLFKEMQNITPLGTTQLDHIDPFVFASLIKACNKLGASLEGKSIHCYVLKLGLDYNVNILNSLVSFYMGSVNLVKYASVLFERMKVKNVVSVNCLVNGYVKNGYSDLGLSLFVQMLRGRFSLILKPNDVTMVILISGCVELQGLGIGSSLHCYCCKTGLDSSVEVCNALIKFYLSFGCTYDAERLFMDALEKDLVTWNTMICGYVKSLDEKKAFALFKEMMNKNVGVDRVSLISLILACANCSHLNMGRMVHGFVKVNGAETDDSVGTALINMYCKFGEVRHARRVFKDLPKHNIATWNSMMHGYVECGFSNEALNIFSQIRAKNLEADEVTYLGLVLACRDLGELSLGSQLHSYIKSNDNLCGSIVLGNAFIDMYAKCGSMVQARDVFDKMPRKDVISWTSLIVGHAVNGEGKESLAAFQKMCTENFVPNAVTFIGVLWACDHAGLVDDGRHLFKIMHKMYRIKPQIEHCGCVVDLLARAGRIEEAHRFVRKMPVEPNAVIWRMLINSCKVYGHLDLSFYFVRGIEEPDICHNPEYYVMSANVFAEAGKWDDVLFRRNMMVAQKAPKLAGKSLVAVSPV